MNAIPLEQGRCRPLRVEEVVHHLLEREGGSGDKTDNRIENLRLFANPGAHTAHHQRLIKEDSDRLSMRS